MMVVKTSNDFIYSNCILQKSQTIVNLCVSQHFFIFYNYMNINTIILIIVILVPVIIIIKKVAGYFINTNKRELVRKLLDEEPTKKIQIIPSKFIRQLSSIMTTKYFCRIFYKKYLDVIK